MTSWHAATNFGEYSRESGITDLYVPNKDMEPKKVALLEDAPPKPDDIHSTEFDAVIARLYDNTSHNHNKTLDSDNAGKISMLDNSTSKESLLELELIIVGSESGSKSCRVDSVGVNVPLIDSNSDMIIGEIRDQFELRPLKHMKSTTIAAQGDSGAPVLRKNKSGEDCKLIGMVNLSNITRGEKSTAWASHIKPIFRSL